MKEIALRGSARTPVMEPARPAGVWLAYLPALDGLRGLAVIAVLLYHAGARWLPGGFLGVEVFFVLSGYLITSLLLAEWRQRGRIDLPRFWLRRGRRLLPALFLLLTGVLAFAVVFLPDEVVGLRRDAIAAAGYVTNWYLALSHASYFETVGRPSLLRHLWSLAVEEQFYLLWPLIFAALMRRWPVRRVGVMALAGAALSTGLMALLYRPDVDPSRIYYGTDTRAAGFLIGAALAFALENRSQRARHLRSAWHVANHMANWAREALGAAALVVLIGFCVQVGEFQPFLYRGGLAAAALVTALVIATSVHPRARLLPRLLGWAPLRWVGLRSYGIYLWHWPVYMVTRPQLDVTLAGLPLLAVRLAVTVLLAEFSYRCVEAPIRGGALGRAWQALRQAHGTQRRWLGVRWASGVAAVTVFAVALGGSVVSAQPPAPPVYLAVAALDTLGEGLGIGDCGLAPVEPGQEVLTDDRRPMTGDRRPTVGDRRPTTGDAFQSPAAPVTTWETALKIAVRSGVEASAGAGRSPLFTQSPEGATPVAMPPTPTPEAPATMEAIVRPVATPTSRPIPDNQLPASSIQPTPPPTLVANRITAVGDSVMLGAADVLTQTIGRLDISAALGRQASAAIDVLKARRTAGQLGAVVVVHVGSNGTFSAKQFDEMMAVLADARQVVFVNVKAPRPWESANNTVLVEGVKHHPNAALVDWQAASAAHPELFWEDGMHVRPEGAQVYAGLIAAAIKSPLAQVQRPAD